MEEKQLKIKFNIIAITMILLFCFAITPKTLQNDTFYTIKIGKYILDNGITMMDPFSWHEGLTYTFPHWGYDVIIYLFYAVGGQLGVYISTILFCMILGVLMYCTNCKICKNRLISFCTTIGALFLLKSYIAARAQLVTFILFVLTVYFIERFLETSKKKYGIGLIIIPILIANLHVAVFPFYFVLYLPYIAEYMIYILLHYGQIVAKAKIESIHKKIQKITDEDKIKELKEKLRKIEEKNDKRIKIDEKEEKEAYKIIMKPSKSIKVLIIIMIICIFTGMLTPLKDVPYTYLLKTMQGNTTQSISEHQALVLVDNIEFMTILLAFIIILMFTKTKIKLCDLFMLAGLTFLAFYTKRQESMFTIICIFILNKLLVNLFNEYAPGVLNRVEKFLVGFIGECIVVILVLLLSWNQYKSKIDDDYIDTSSYPVYAVEWIKENLDIENIKLYNEYNYGSYLLLNDIPVFIDSRADLYAPEFNDGVTIFDDFLAISGLNESDMEAMLNKYEFTHYMMYSNARLRIYMKSNSDKYQEIYDDGSFCIYENI